MCRRATWAVENTGFANAVGAPSFDFGNSVVYVGTVAGIVYAVVPPLPSSPPVVSC